MSYLDSEEAIEDAIQLRIDQAEITLNIAVAQQDIEQVNLCCNLITLATMELAIIKEMGNHSFALPTYDSLPS